MYKKDAKLVIINLTMEQLTEITDALCYDWLYDFRYGTSRVQSVGDLMFKIANYLDHNDPTKVINEFINLIVLQSDDTMVIFEIEGRIPPL